MDSGSNQIAPSFEREDERVNGLKTCAGEQNCYSAAERLPEELQTRPVPVDLFIKALKHSRLLFVHVVLNSAPRPAAGAGLG